jgi:hypothetical protein
MGLEFKFYRQGHRLFSYKPSSFERFSLVDLSTSSIIHQRVFPSHCKLRGLEGGDFLDGGFSVALSHKTYCWDVGASNLQLIASRIDGPS